MTAKPGGATAAHVDFLADLDVLRPEWPITQLLTAGDDDARIV